MSSSKEEMNTLLEKVSKGDVSMKDAKRLKELITLELDSGLAKKDPNRALALIFMVARMESIIRGL